MLPAPGLHAVPAPDNRVVASLGAYTLLRISDREYELHGPNPRCPTDWLISRLPAGDWWTEWSGRGATFALKISC